MIDAADGADPKSQQHGVSFDLRIAGEWEELAACPPIARRFLPFKPTKCATGKP